MPAFRIITDIPIRQDFNRHITLELLVMRAVHYAHAARADSFNDSVMADDLANHHLRLSAAILGCDLMQVNEYVGFAAISEQRRMPEKEAGI